MQSFILCCFIFSYFVWGCYSLGCWKWYDAVHFRFKFTLFSSLLCSGANSKFLFFLIGFLKCSINILWFVMCVLWTVNGILYYCHCRILYIYLYTVSESSVSPSDTASADTSKFGLPRLGDCSKLHQSSVLFPFIGAVTSWGTVLWPSFSGCFLKVQTMCRDA